MNIVVSVDGHPNKCFSKARRLEFFEFLVTDLRGGACFGKAIITGKRYQGNEPSPVSEYYNIHQEMLNKVNIYGILPPRPFDFPRESFNLEMHGENQRVLFF